MPEAGIEAGEDLRQLGFDIAHCNPFEKKTVSAVFAIPRESIQFVRSATPFDHDADAARGPPR
jgi:hypothetical protein